MMEDFTEKQCFLKHWWFILLPVFVFGSIAVWVDDEAQTETYQIVIFFVAITLVLLLFLFMCLHTRINEKGIEVQFKPLMFKVRKIQWNDVVQVQVIEYSPLFDYGGWGYRKSFSGKKAALNVYGNQGLELILKDDTKLMIGTQRKDDLNNYLSYIKRKYQLQQIVA
jgi:hypothetical protein